MRFGGGTALDGFLHHVNFREDRLGCSLVPAKTCVFGLFTGRVAEMRVHVKAEGQEAK